jgi:hypothetical protein
VQENVVRRRTSFCTDPDTGPNAGDDSALDHIINIIQHLAQVARAHGEPLLGRVLDDVLPRRGPMRLKALPILSSSGGALG